MSRLSVKAWQRAIAAAAKAHSVWAAYDEGRTLGPVNRLGTLFHVMHLAPYCREYKRKYHPNDPGLDAGSYWQERDERSKYPDDPEWRQDILHILRTVPAGTPIPQFRFEVPTYHGLEHSNVLARQFLRTNASWQMNYEGTTYHVEFDLMLPDELFLTPPADDHTYELAEICSYLPKLRSYLEQRT